MRVIGVRAGQTQVVSTILLVAISVALVGSYYIFSQQLYGSTQSQLAAEIDKYHKLASQYLSISSAVAKLEGPIVTFTVTVVNGGDVPISTFSNQSWYVYYRGVVYKYGQTASCPPVLNPGDICAISFSFPAGDLKTREDFYKTSVTVYVNEVPLSSTVKFLGSFPGTALFSDCYGCSDCSSKISAAKPNSVVIMHFTSPADGNCVEVNGAKDVTLYCDGKLTGNGSGNGISIINTNNVTIKSCEIFNFSRGIFVKNSTGTSLSSVYLHDNNVNLEISPDTLSDVCDFASVELATDSGPLQWFSGASSTNTSLLSASAIWIKDSRGVSISGSGVALRKISPAIAICDSNSVSLSDLSVQSSIGVYARNDISTRLESLNISATLRGIVSEDSNNGYICCTTIRSPADVFLNPQTFEWDENTIFST